MSWITECAKTYDTFIDKYGARYENCKEPLSPMSCFPMKSEVEVRLTSAGEFLGVSFSPLGIIAPVTEESACRTNTLCTHPLCDKLTYLLDTKSREVYLEQLGDWCHSNFSHPDAVAVYDYVLKNSINSDFAVAGYSLQDLHKIKYEDMCVRWIVDDNPVWKNLDLMNRWHSYYVDWKRTNGHIGFCMETCEETVVAKKYPRGTFAESLSKIISTNDPAIYRGRFDDADGAITLGYELCQKAHNALRWLCINDAIGFYGSTAKFVCWKPDGKEDIYASDKQLCPFDEDEHISKSEYKQKLYQMTVAKSNNIKLGPSSNKAIIMILDSISKGRISILHYAEIPYSQYLMNMEKWDEDLATDVKFNFGDKKCYTPSLDIILDYAYGIYAYDNEKKMKTMSMDRRSSLYAKKKLELMQCRIYNRPIPRDIVKHLVYNCSRMGIYDPYIRNNLIAITVAVLNKANKDLTRREPDMALDKNKTNRSFQYGRLLAVFDKIELDKLRAEESKRTSTHATDLTRTFIQNPKEVTSRLRIITQVYLNKNNYRGCYEKMLEEIFANITDASTDTTLGAPLTDDWIFGYYYQKKSFYSRNEQSEKASITESN